MTTSTAAQLSDYPAKPTLSDLRGGEIIRLLLHREHKEPSDIETRFLGFVTESEYFRARFQEENEPFVWNARQVGSRWLYGVNEHEYVTIDEIIKPGSGYIHDDHLTRLGGRVKAFKEDADFLSSEQRAKKKNAPRSKHHATGMPRHGK